MNNKKVIPITFSIFLLLAFTKLIFAAEPEANKELAKQWMNRPVRFLENEGQMINTNNIPVPFVLFKASGPGMDVYITEKGLTYVFVKTEEKQTEEQEIMQNGNENEKTEIAWINMHLKGAHIKKESIIKEIECPEQFNYFYPHCPDGIYNVKQYGKITIKNIYPGIDWVFYNSSKTGMKYDFIVHPGADPSQIKLVYESENELKLDSSGNITIQTQLGILKENAPYSYIQDSKKIISSKFLKTTIDRHLAEVTFQLGWTNINKNTLVIDPQLTWATFFGGNSYDGIMSICADENDNIYATGYESSTNFPAQPWGGAYNDNTLAAIEDVMILKFSNTGMLIWATLYNGSAPSSGNSICYDGLGNIYITGNTSAADFPTQIWGAAYFDNAYGGGFPGDVFILRFTSTTGVRTWASYYGGSGGEAGTCIYCDASGGIYLTGYTYSANFPVQPWGGAYFDNAMAGGQDIFILYFSNIGTRFWATLYGGSSQETASSIIFDGLGNLYLTGNTNSSDFPIQTWAGAYNKSIYGGMGAQGDVFILRFTAASGTLTWATYYGGSAADAGHSIMCDTNNNVYITGYTQSSDFPTVAWGVAYLDNILGGGQDAFIVRFTNSGALSWASYYGGSGNDGYDFLSRLSYNNIAIDSCGNVYISFETKSTDVFVYGDTNCGFYDPNHTGFGLDIFIVKFNNASEVLWATYFGGDGSDQRESITIDNTGNLVIAGEWRFSTNGNTYPLTDPGGGAYFNSIPNGSDDSYIAKFLPSPPLFSKNQVNSTTCTPCNGSATINVSCGDRNFNYVWSNGSSTTNSSLASNTISGLCPGTYTVTVTNNCVLSQTETFIITGTPCVTCSISGQFTKGTSNCVGCGCKQWIMITATDGTSPYSYTWPDGYVNRYRNQLCPGTYIINITDKNGCSVNVNLSAP